MCAEAECIAGSCHCKAAGQVYVSLGGADSMYANATSQGPANEESTLQEGCHYTVNPQPFVTAPLQELPQLWASPGQAPDLAPLTSQTLPPPLDIRQASGLVSTNMSLRLQMPETRYPLPLHSLGLADR